MSHALEAVPPSLETLLSGFLTADRTPMPEMGEVEPYQATPINWVEPALLWSDALAVAKHLLPTKAAETFAPSRFPLSSDWSQLVRGLAPQTFVFFALGHAPAMVRDVTQWLAPRSTADAEEGNVIPWSPTQDLRREPRDLLMSQACARLGGSMEAAKAWIEQAEFPADWASLVANERAVLHWARGDRDTARRGWEALPVSPVRDFNLGLAALVDGSSEAATRHFSAAAAKLSDTDPWHHLALLYLTVTDLD